MDDTMQHQWEYIFGHRTATCTVQPKTTAAIVLPLPLAGKTSTGTYQWLLTMSLRFSRQPVTSQLRHQISIFTRPHQHTPPENINPEINRVPSVITPHHVEIFRGKSLQFARNAVIRVNVGNRLLLNMIWISIFLWFMTIVQLFAKFAPNHLAKDKHLPPIKSQSILPIAIKILVLHVRSYICQQTPFPGAHVVIILLASPAKVQYC